MLNKEQQLVDQCIELGMNIFVTGGAGVGKTYTVNKCIEKLRKNGKNVMVCAPTGIAALLVHGVTLHRQFKAPLGVIKYKEYNYIRNDELCNTDTLVIEEISMCRMDLFDFVMRQVADANAVRRSLGMRNIQIVVVGDFFQLPPVIKDSESKVLNAYYGKDVGAAFAFNSNYWNLCEFKVIELYTIMRQKDRTFSERLNRIRIGDRQEIENIYNSSSRNRVDSAITICGTNSEVKEHNIRELQKLRGTEVRYNAIISGDVYETDTNCDFELVLKVGARVMTLINTDEYTNGLIGTVVELLDNEIVVKMDSGIVTRVERYRWDIFRYEIINRSENDFDDTKLDIVEVNVGFIEQFPVKLSYAISIHKSQGQTFENVNIRPYCWDCGQLYVAMSRVKDIRNMYFEYKPELRYLAVSLNVIRMYNESKRFNGDLSEYNVDRAKSNKRYCEDADLILSKLAKL